MFEDVSKAEGALVMMSCSRHQQCHLGATLTQMTSAVSDKSLWTSSALCTSHCRTASAETFRGVQLYILTSSDFRLCKKSSMFFAMYSVGLSWTPAKSPNPVMTKWTISLCLCPYRTDNRLMSFFQPLR